MFDLEWTTRNYDRDGTAADKARAAAERYCEKHGIDPFAAWWYAQETNEVIGQWSDIEYAAFRAAFADWQVMPENVSLIWRN